MDALVLNMDGNLLDALSIAVKVRGGGGACISLPCVMHRCQGEKVADKDEDEG